MISVLICASVNRRAGPSATARGAAIASVARTPKVTTRLVTATRLITLPPVVIRQWSITRCGGNKARARVARRLVRGVCDEPQAPDLSLLFDLGGWRAR